ncbi:MAG TPA: Gfo/Idh/MocA family oxidoreductase [Verrucomicrobiae bacterium]
MEIKLALVGAGMFGGDVHLRAYADLQRSGISPLLGRIGFGDWARDFAGIHFKLLAVATRTEKSARLACNKFKGLAGGEPQPYWGQEPWTNLLTDHPDLDVMAVATPDHLHTPVILDALKAGVHVIAEKPLCLDINEADQIIDLAGKQSRIVALDMHKRYDPDHLRIRADLLRRIGEPLYGTAYLEEPLQVSTSTFKWAEKSDPFSYVGSHWVDLLYHYFGSKPASLTAVGQKKRLARDGIEAYDAVQVRVDFQNGLSISFHNNWITPPDFEGPVNQGHEIVGTDGKIESDQQYRGLRWWEKDGGSRTANTHFTREVRRPEGPPACVGYGTDSIIAGLVAICRFKFLGAALPELASLYPNAEDARVVVAIIHAARLVRDLNFRYLQEGKGAVASARFGADGITIVDPNRAGEGPGAVFQKICRKTI